MMEEKQPAACWAVVVAAGRGRRFGKPYNKVFHALNGRSVLMRCLDALAASGAFEGAVLVLSEQDRPGWEELVRREGAPALVRAIAPGGATRQESVMSGLSLVPEDVAIVAIHDAARPFVTPGIVRAAIESAAARGSGVPGSPVTDTIKLLDEDGNAIATPPRERLCAVQTPQAFRRSEIMAAHEQARREGYASTDDAALYEKYIGKVHVVMTPECAENIKVTTLRDVVARECHFRTGTGYDAHRLVAGRKLILCGVEIPCDMGLLGHSDADVAVHALMDALLGAAGLGDIGRHFPDSDPQYEGVSSLLLLDRVRLLLHEAGYRLVNADVTIVAQRPKLKEYMDAMKRNVAAHLQLPEGQVNVKATTTEGMGFEGEGLGISAQAAALIAKER